MKKEILILTGIIVSVLVLGVFVMAATTQTSTASVTVNTFLSVTLTTGAPVTFPNMDPGTGPTAATNNPLTATIGVESNVNANVLTKGAANFCKDYPTCAGDKFAVSNMKWSATAEGIYADYLITDASVCTPVTPGNACNIYHKLTIPGGTKAGSYSTGITITATPV